MHVRFLAAKHFGGKWFHKFTVVVAQKNHQTICFLPNEHNRNEVNNVIKHFHGHG
jgi:hypothetical protein